VIFSAILENAILNRNPQTPHDLRFRLKSQIISVNKQSQTCTKQTRKKYRNKKKKNHIRNIRNIIDQKILKNLGQINLSIIRNNLYVINMVKLVIIKIIAK